MITLPKNPIGALHGLFEPSKIAVIGASDDINKIGGFIFSQLNVHSSAQVYPINAKKSSIQHVKAYASITQTPKTPDLAIIAVPSAIVLPIVEECGKKGVKNIVIISAGFKEVGTEGKQREEELKTIISNYNLNVIGPNCLGFLNTQNSINASFAKEIPNKGSIGFVSQSGAVIDAVLDWSFEHRIGFSKVVSVGNMAGVNQLDMLRYFRHDPKTSAVVFYLETLEHGKEFAEELRATTKEKPVVVIKPGTSLRAQKAIGSHTGSLAQDGSLVKTLIEDNNGIYVETLDELYNILISLSSSPVTSHRLSIVTNAGGPGVITTDLVEKSAFELTDLHSKTKKSLQKVLPKEASPHNPVDVLGDATAQRYKDALNVLLKAKEVDVILVLLTPQIMTDSYNIAQEITQLSKNSSKPIFASFLGGKEIRPAVDFFNEHNIPHFQTPSQGLKAMSSLLRYHTHPKKERKIIPQVSLSKIHTLRNELAKNKGLVPYSLTKKILKSIGITLPKRLHFESMSDVHETNLSPTKRYVLKGEGVVHKKEAGAVVKDITSLNFHEEARKMFSRLKSHTSKPQLLLEEEKTGHEVMIGLMSDPTLGNFIAVGSGGSYVNVYKDIVFSTAPLSLKKVQTLLPQTKIYSILKGYRGDKSIDFETFNDILIRLSYLQEFFPEIVEVDINPALCSDKSIDLVDVKLLTSSK